MSDFSRRKILGAGPVLGAGAFLGTDTAFGQPAHEALDGR